MQVCNPTTPGADLPPAAAPGAAAVAQAAGHHDARRACSGTSTAVSTLEDLSERRVPAHHLATRGVRQAGEARPALHAARSTTTSVAAREAKKRHDVAIVRLEQLYPLADELLVEALAPYRDAELVWVQEEPFNMGAWYHLNARWPAALGRLACVSRPESASPATGSEKSHKYEQQLLMDQAFGDAPPSKP